MTISSQELNRTVSKRGGWDITARFTDSETGEVRQKTMYFPRSSPSVASVTARFVHNAERMEFKVNPLNDLDIEGVDVRDLLTKLVSYIRAHPDVTFNALVAVADNQFPDLPWKPEKMLLKLQSYLEQRLKITFTFAQFKTYVINHKFCGVDG